MMAMLAVAGRLPISMPAGYGTSFASLGTIDHVRQRGGKSPSLRGGHDQAAWGGSCGISAMMGGVAISVMAS
ncbi:MAG: hypothetical protein AB7O80_25880, partial [Acetobacteraceae bacterium]